MNMTDWWNYLLASLDVVGLIALRAVGKKNAKGWLWAMFTQAVWIVYALSTFQWGFLAVAAVKLGIYTWNWISWVRGDRAAEKAAEPETLEELATKIIDVARGETKISPQRLDVYVQSMVRFAKTLSAAERTPGEEPA